jgi:hypothetical protein
LAACFTWYFTWWLGKPRPDINRASFERIKKGMTLPEVEAIIGAPAGDYTTGPTSSYEDGWYGPGDKEWIGDDGVISIWFDTQDGIKDMSFEPVTPLTGFTWFERLQMQVGLKEKTERIMSSGPY